MISRAVITLLVLAGPLFAGASAEKPAAAGSGSTLMKQVLASTVSEAEAAKIDWPVRLSEAEWRKRLTPFQYSVLREKDTEQPFTGEYDKNHREGTYYSAATGQPLFASSAKFDSGTGWPSFDQALPGAVEFKADNAYGMHRTEVLCAECGSHLGHIFDDGPTATGKRYCLNSVCLDLLPTDEGKDAAAQPSA
jgi:peptide-methionine (R)-S-oxide reductase